MAIRCSFDLTCQTCESGFQLSWNISRIGVPCKRASLLPSTCRALQPFQSQLTALKFLCKYPDTPIATSFVSLKAKSMQLCKNRTLYNPVTTLFRDHHIPGTWAPISFSKVAHSDLPSSCHTWHLLFSIESPCLTVLLYLPQLTEIAHPKQ